MMQGFDMPLIRPFAGLRPATDRAAEVVAPPYDVVSRAEAAALVEGRPNSFLHISRAEIDLPESTDPYDPAVYARAAENLARMQAEGVLVRDPEPYYYVYRMVMGEHTQVGLVAAASVAAYDQNRVRKHEFTRPAKEDDRVRQIEALNAQTGPVLLAFRHDPAVTSLLARGSETAPEVDVTAQDGVRHSLWAVRDRELIGLITEAFDAMPAIYIADGHHRSAAASRVAAARGGDLEAPHRYFLSVVFPDQQMRIFDYNRVVKDLNGLSSEAFLARVAERFEVVPWEGQARPELPGEYGLYLDRRWYRLVIDAERVPHGDPVARLDVSLLQDNLIEPVLGISDPRRDPRIDFVGGIRGLEGLEQRVDSGEMAAALALYPTSMDDLMAVAEAGEVMPPKSTWFEPKLVDGLVSHVLD
jgi:uncharacterized protein (DUF1015 family)